MVSMKMAKEYTLKIPKNLPDSTGLVDVITKETNKLTPCAFSGIQQYVAMMRNLDESG